MKSKLAILITMASMIAHAQYEYVEKPKNGAAQRGGRGVNEDEGGIAINVDKGSAAQLPKLKECKDRKEFDEKLQSAANMLASLAVTNSNGKLKGFGKLTVTPTLDKEGNITALRIEDKDFVFSGPVRVERRFNNIEKTEFTDRLMFRGTISK